MPIEAHFPDPLEDADPLRCEVDHDRTGARLRLSGELDLAGVPVLEKHLGELVGQGAREVVVDLSGLKFLDATGLRCLLEWNACASRDGFSLVLVPGPRAVQRVFEVTRTAGMLPFQHS